MLLLVFVHGYNLHDTYLQPFSRVSEPLGFTTFTEFWLANGLFRFRIPMLFIISGYLFALHDTKPYGERIRKRLKSLGIPYLIWSAVGLLITFAWQQFPFTAQAVRDCMLDQLGDNRPYTEIGVGGLLLRWILAPIAFQLWFIRSLLLYNIAYPWIRRAVTSVPKVWFPIAVFLWLATFAMPFIEGEGLLFFSLGIFMQKTDFDLEKPARGFNPAIWVFLFVGSSLLKTFIAFKAGPVAATFVALVLLHKLCVFSGLVTMWYGCDGVVRWFMNRKWFVWSSAFAFIIYALHAPLVYYCTKIVFHFTGYWTYHRLLTFIFLPLLITGFSILLGACMRKAMPAFYSLATGGRGLG